MEQTKNDTTKTGTKMTHEKMFQRDGRVGFNFLSIRKENGEPTFVKILKCYERENKEGEKNLFFDAIDMKTGEEGMIYIDGGLKGQLSTLGGPQKAVGLCLEIIYKGMVETSMTINGKLTETEVNAYDVFKIKEN